MANIPKKVLDRLSKEVGKFQKILIAAKDRDINEADTLKIVTDMLSDIFGFDKYTEITSEYVIKGTYCDIAVKIDDTLKYLMEVKAVGIDLKDSHLRQAINYGANQGIQWVILTNGIYWEIYRIKFEKPLDYDRIFYFNFLDLNPRKRESQEHLFMLCKEGISKDVIEEYHEHIKSVNKFVIGAILQMDQTVDLVRRELRRITPGIKIERDEIQDIITNEILKREIVDGKQAENAKTYVKKASAKALKKVKTPKAETTEGV